MKADSKIKHQTAFLWLRKGLIAVCMLFSMQMVYAQIDGHGPDAWRVVDLEPGESLDVRMGPGMEYPVTGQIAGDARGLRQVTCVPLYTLEIYQRLSAQERFALGQRWCLMQTGDFGVSGWVPQAFIAEDSQ
ncbi:hypothetical protein [Orrella sp. 11846]|uniref:hypothetical protein n=1 Tax=Orrella sp. 11846 TaxID=3409913 RepID=UPI003B5AEA6A